MGPFPGKRNLPSISFAKATTYLLKWKAKEKASRCISIGERAGLYLIFQPFPYRGMKKKGSFKVGSVNPGFYRMPSHIEVPLFVLTLTSLLSAFFYLVPLIPIDSIEKYEIIR